MRVLHLGDDYVRSCAAAAQSVAERERDRQFHGRQCLPLRNISAHRECHSEGGKVWDGVLCREGSGPMNDETFTRTFHWNLSATNSAQRLRTASIWIVGSFSSFSAPGFSWFRS